MDQNNEHVE